MAEEKLRFLADASMLLAGSLDTGETLRQLAHMVVPRFADWCTITLRGEDDVLRRIVGVHKDPAAEPAMTEYLRNHGPAEGSPEHLRENVGARDVRLTPADLEELEARLARLEIYGGRMNATQMAQIGQD